jgi:hypothetical protein
MVPGTYEPVWTQLNLYHKASNNVVAGTEMTWVLAEFFFFRSFPTRPRLILPVSHRGSHRKIFPSLARFVVGRVGAILNPKDSE